MSQAEEHYSVMKKASEWLQEHVNEPEKTTVSQACFVLQGGIMIMCAQHALEATLQTSVCYGDLVSSFVEQLEEARQKLGSINNS